LKKQTKAAIDKLLKKSFKWVMEADIKRLTCKVSPPVDLYLISEKSIWKNQVRQTGFLAYFELNFCSLCSLQKSISKLIFAS
jgi:hypothetical protein